MFKIKPYFDAQLTALKLQQLVIREVYSITVTDKWILWKPLLLIGNKCDYGSQWVNVNCVF